MASDHSLLRSFSLLARADRSAVDENEAFQRAKSRALIDLLNDLRTPLMMIKSPLQATQEGEDTTPSPATVADLLQQADRIQEGLEKVLEILELDLLDKGTHDLSTDFASAVDRYIWSLRPLSDRSGVTVQYTSELAHAYVPLHLAKIQYLLDVIVEGAVNLTEAGGVVTVRLKRAGAGTSGDVTLEVERADEEEASGSAPIFDTRYAHTLELARHHVAGCGGTLTTVDGCTYVNLPARDLQAAPANDESVDVPIDPDEDRIGGDGSEMQTTVLIVDDHPGTRAYLRYAFRKYHRVLEAADGQAGLDLVREHQPDLVISDIMMPRMDGNELCRRIKSDDHLKHIPVFLVTANSMPSIRARGLESGADDYLVKPVNIEEAVMRVNNEINSRRDLRRHYSRQVIIKPSEISVTSEDDALIKRATEVVEKNMENSEFSVQELASEIGFSSRQLQRRLKEIADQSPVEFIRKLRLQRAAQLLEARYGNVSEVAYQVGFTSLSYFAKCFKEEFGESPSVYKDRYDDR